MDYYEAELRDLLGDKFYQEFLNYFDRGNISEDDAAALATQLHSKAGKTFQSERNTKNFQYNIRSLKNILSEWYVTMTLHDYETANTHFISCLTHENVLHLRPLANKLTTVYEASRKPKMKARKRKGKAASQKMYVCLHRRRPRSVEQATCPHPTEVHCCTKEEVKSFREDQDEYGWDEATAPIIVNLSKNCDYEMTLQPPNENSENLNFSVDDVLDCGTVRIGSIDRFPIPGCANRKLTSLHLKPTMGQEEEEQRQTTRNFMTTTEANITSYINSCSTPKKTEENPELSAGEKFTDNNDPDDNKKEGEDGKQTCARKRKTIENGNKENQVLHDDPKDYDDSKTYDCKKEQKQAILDGAAIVFSPVDFQLKARRANEKEIYQIKEHFYKKRKVSLLNTFNHIFSLCCFRFLSDLSSSSTPKRPSHRG